MGISWELARAPQPGLCGNPSRTVKQSRRRPWLEPTTSGYDNRPTEADHGFYTARLLPGVSGVRRFPGEPDKLIPPSSRSVENHRHDDATMAKHSSGIEPLRRRKRCHGSYDRVYDRADAHIHLANKQADEIGRGKVSASFRYAVAQTPCDAAP